jgi:stearoyl-CoA desaturase (delta-9 desaturase)
MMTCLMSFLPVDWSTWAMATIGAYVPTIFFIQWMMSNRTAYDLRRTQKVWNIVMSVSSFTGFVMCVRPLLEVGFESSYSTFDVGTPSIRFVLFAFQLSKIPEFLDTLFIVLQKKELIPLHWIHHISVAIYCLICVFYPPTTGFWFAFMNMFVHGVMYGYFAFTRELQKLPWFNPLVITILQILQMCAGLAISVLHLVHKDTVLDFHTIADKMYAIPMYAGYLYLFCRFLDAKYSFKTPVNWTMCAWLLIQHVAGLIGLLHCLYGESRWLLAEVIVWYQVTGWGVTVGMHRLWCHRSFKARTPTRILLMLLASMANQGDIYHWCRDHRSHHKYSDTSESEGDPHDIRRGFFWAHIGWLMLKKDPATIALGKNIPSDNLLADRVVRFHQWVNPLWNQFWCFVVPGLYGIWRIDSFLYGVLIFGSLRWLLVLHATCCVNSIAHMYGNRPYSDITPSESFITSLLACGEGWHNYHHTHPWDYATAEHTWWFQWNTSKMLIDFLAIFGQTYDHKRKTKHQAVRGRSRSDVCF